jgi:hypothetical protein
VRQKAPTAFGVNSSVVSGGCRCRHHAYYDNQTEVSTIVVMCAFTVVMMVSNTVAAVDNRLAVHLNELGPR